jgi:hypothetical protein
MSLYLLDVQTNPLNPAGHALIAERLLSMSAKMFGSQRLIVRSLEFGVRRLEGAGRSQDIGNTVTVLVHG